MKRYRDVKMDVDLGKGEGKGYTILETVVFHLFYDKLGHFHRAYMDLGDSHPTPCVHFRTAGQLDALIGALKGLRKETFE